MSDVNKLSGIITALELQAKKVSEFSGLLSVVNDARKEIEASKGLLEAASVESRQFLRNSKDNFVGLERHLLAQVKKLDQIESAQNQVQDRLASLDILTPQVLSVVIDARKEIEASKGLLEAASVESRQFLRNTKDNFVGVERHLLAQAKKLEQIESAQNQVRDRLTSLDILTPQVFLEATNASQNILLDSLQKLERKIDKIQAVQAQRHKNLLGLCSITFVVILAALAFLR